MAATLLIYFIVGIIGFAGYPRVNAYLKVIYVFLFPLHWVVGVWFTEVIKSVTAENFWDHQLLWAGIGVVLCLLFALGS